MKISDLYQKRSIRKALYILAGIIIVILISEGAVRFIYKKKFDRYLPSPLNYQPDSLIGFRYEPNTTFNVAGNTVTVNSHGFLGREFSINKDKDTFRIAMVGSCTVSGVVNYQFYSNPCIYLQKLFDQNHWNVEVINLGIDGAFRDYELFNTVRYEALKYNPDLIVSESFLPFVSIFYVRERYRDYTIQYSYGSKLLRNEAIKRVDQQYSFSRRIMFYLYDHSYLIKAMHAFLYHRGYNIRIVKDMYNHYDKRYIVNVSRPQFWTAEKSKEMLDATYLELKNQGIEFVFFSGFKNPQMKKILGDDYNYMYVFKPSNWKDRFEYYDSQHYSDEGNKYIAKCLYEYLTCGNFVPNSYKTR